METQKPLLKDEDGEEVDVHMYRSMIGSLMYLTSSRPDIMFAVCACARYQVNPKVSHLHVVKRIFRYLKVLGIKGFLTVTTAGSSYNRWLELLLLLKIEEKVLTLQEAHDEESCLEEQILSLMHRFLDRFTRRRPEIDRLMTLPDHPLIDYGRYAIERMIEADMRNASYLKMVRDELLRSMDENREFIKNYKEMLNGVNRGPMVNVNNNVTCDITDEEIREVGEQIGIKWDANDDRTVGVEGIGDDGKKGWLKSIINEEKSDIIGLQEIKSGGILLIWDANIFVCGEAIGDERFMAIKGNWKGKIVDVYLVCVYGPHVSLEKSSLWDELLTLMERMGGAWCIFEDFNVIKRPDDRLNSQVNIKEMDDFNDLVNVSRLIEVPMGGQKFTRVSDDGRKFSKLDRFLLNDKFKEQWVNLAVVAIDQKLSDHCPIVLKDMDLDFGPKPFRFFDTWLEEKDIGQVVAGAWEKEVRSSRPDCRFRDKLKNVKMEVKMWSRKRFGVFTENIVEHRKEAIRWFWEKTKITRGCNASFITVIPKVADPIGLGDYRPISLIGSYYKIIAKMLVERVKKVVGDVVGDAQTAFIKGRFILDGVLVVNETMEFIHFPVKAVVPGFLWKSEVSVGAFFLLSAVLFYYCSLRSSIYALRVIMRVPSDNMEEKQFSDSLFEKSMEENEITHCFDACNTAKEMWTAIERLQQGESLNVQDVKTNLFWEFGKFTSRDGESMESIITPAFDVLNQFQTKLYDIPSERLARSANLLALLAAAQPYSDNYYQAPKPQRSNAPSYMQSSSTRPSATTRHKGKEIAKPVTPQSESVSEEDSDPEQARRDKDMQKNLALLAKYFKKLYKPTNNNLRTSSNSRNKTEDTTPRECKKPKRVKDYAYHKEKMMMCKQAEQGVPLQAEQADWLEDTDEEIDEQELEAHYSYMAKIQEVSPKNSSFLTSPPYEHMYLEKDDSNVIPDSSNICTNDNQVDQNAAECVDERAALANLIAILTLDTEENKTQTDIAQWGETVTLEKESRSKLDKDKVKPYDYTYQNSLYETFKPPSKTYLDQLERAKEVRKTMWRKTFNRTKPNIAKNVSFLPISKSISKSRQVYNEMTNNFNHFRTICEQTWSNHIIVHFPYPNSKSMERLIKTLLMPLSNKTILDSHCFVHELKKEMHDDLEYVKSLEKEIDELESEKADFSNIYDLLLEESFDKPSVVRQPNAQRIPKPSVLGKPTPFSNSPEMRSFQTNKSVNKTNASDGLFKPVTQQNLPRNRNQAVQNTNVLKPGMFRIASTTTQTRTPQLPHASRNTNPHMSKSSGVIHTTSVSRPQLKCYQVKDKVVPKNSQVKFQKKEVEDHHRISSISKKTKSVTACNDSSNSRTSNENANVNARTKKPNVVPISASKPKRKANKSVATPHKKTVASDTTIQKSKSYYKELYENTNQEWKWWIAKRCPSGYTWTQNPLRTKKIWMPKIRKDDESTSITHDGQSQAFVEKFLGTVHFGNDQFAPILGYGDLIQGNVTIKRSLLRRRPQSQSFSVGKFCDAVWRVAFRKSTYFVRDLQGKRL
ncbi:retrovirus-related pol polyprotein from transposon TNT 1-94 [Tanacetum coccineum]